MTEQTLIANLQAHDPAAYAVLIESYSNLVYRVVYNILQTPQDAEDALQETFITIYNQIGNFRGESKLSSWIYRVATNTALNCIQRKKRKMGQDVPMISDDDDEETELEIGDALTPLPETMLESQETAVLLHEALQELSPKLRSALVLFELEGLSMKETAVALDISESAAKLRVRRARIELQRILARHMQETTVS
ncbi:MAG: RNA polymerase sigma factor [Ardenticatenaceae bacterium]|nr:RNA polymerase sigma factor [Anaerolineales bacterium]MCB8920885.1 RNA polymerase sigma factor [Ardenticatenaceae bacterium]